MFLSAKDSSRGLSEAAPAGHWTRQRPLVVSGIKIGQTVILLSRYSRPSMILNNRDLAMNKTSKNPSLRCLNSSEGDRKQIGKSIKASKEIGSFRYGCVL